MTDPINFFTSRFNITIADIESLLAAALCKGGDYADLYFEYTVNNALQLEEQNRNHEHAHNVLRN